MLFLSDKVRFYFLTALLRHHNILQNDMLQNDTQHNDTKQND
jgi:hypothetical protein